MNVGEMQRKLSLWAEQNKERKFFGLHDLLCDKDWLLLAHDRVARNAGSMTAGCDGMNMKDFDENLNERLQELRQELEQEVFEPYPVRRVKIPKSDGGNRPLGIPSIRDRIVQEAVRMVLEPIYEADFCQSSFGFRPNRSTEEAIRRATWYTQERLRYFWIIEGDIFSYFDTINHKKLIKLLGRRVKDKKLLKLIGKFLRAGVMEGKLFKDIKQGTPQGGIISPLLANIYLHELDKHMEIYTALSEIEKKKNRRNNIGNFAYVRYADDFVILTNGTKRDAEAMKEETCKFLCETLKLKLSLEKTKISHINDGFEFLGFEVKRCRGLEGMRSRINIPGTAIRKVLKNINAITDKSTEQDSVNTKILALNRTVGGWCHYYRCASSPYKVFHDVEHQMYWRMAHWLGRKHKLRTPAVMKRYGHKSTFGTETYKMLQPTTIKVQRRSTRFLKPNPYVTQDRLAREELPREYKWTGYEPRPGMDDLRYQALERDNFRCRKCGVEVTSKTSEGDHIRPVKRFKKPVDANYLENVQTLCIPCHRNKTLESQQVESRVQ